jgi:hypothetical protein
MIDNADLGSLGVREAGGGELVVDIENELVSVIPGHERGHQVDAVATDSSMAMVG